MRNNGGILGSGGVKWRGNGKEEMARERNKIYGGLPKIGLVGIL